MDDSPANILMVDDDPHVLRSLRAALESHGYRVRSAVSGQGALDARVGVDVGERRVGRTRNFEAHAKGGGQRLDGGAQPANCLNEPFRAVAARREQQRAGRDAVRAPG